MDQAAIEPRNHYRQTETVGWCSLDSSERHSQTQHNCARPLSAPRQQKVRIVAIYKLRAKAEYRVVEHIEHVDSRANSDSISNRKRPRRAEADRACAGPRTIIAREVAGRTNRRKR